MSGAEGSNRGLISLEGDSVRFRLPSGDGWQVPLESVRVIGEYTTQDGPLADDWFIVFVTGGGADEPASGWECYEAPFYAYGLDSFMGLLRRELLTLGAPGLAVSADFASRVLWPAELEGRPLFDFTVAEPRGIIGRIRAAWTKTVRREFTAEVLECLGRGRPR